MMELATPESELKWNFRLDQMNIMAHGCDYDSINHILIYNHDIPQCSEYG